LLGFGAQQNPIDRRRLRWLREGAQKDLNVPLRPLKAKTLDGLADTGDDVMPVGRAQASRDDASDIAETNDGNSRTLPG
jgi:hypothetical protein